MTTTKPTTRTRKPRTENTKEKENSMTITEPTPASTVTAATGQQRSTALPDVLADPDLPQWKAAPHRLDLGYCLAAGHDQGLAEHRAAWEQERRRRLFAAYGAELADAADQALDAARNALDDGLTPEQAHQRYLDAQQARERFDTFDAAFLRPDHPTLDEAVRRARELRTRSRRRDAANEALADGMARRRFAVAAYADAELVRASVAGRYGNPPYRLPDGLRLAHLETAAKPIRAAEARLEKVKAEIARGGDRPAGSRRHPDDIKRYLELIELPNAVDRLADLRALAPTGD